MKSLNRLELIGRVGNDVEYKNNRVPLSLAVSKSIKKGDQWEETTHWFYVNFFAQTAERLAKKVQRGDAIFVDAELSINEYQGKKSIQIIGRNFILMSTKNRDAGGYNDNYNNENKAYNNGGQVPPASHIDDNVPF